MSTLTKRQSLERDAALASNTKLTVSPSLANVFAQPMDIHMEDSTSSVESSSQWAPINDHNNHKASRAVSFDLEKEHRGLSFSSTSTPQINNHSNEMRVSFPSRNDRRSTYVNAIQDKSQRMKARQTLNKRMGQAHPSLRGYQYVIFPEKKLTQLWDLTIIIFTVYNAFWIPYQFGMSGGYYKLTSNGFVIFSFVVDLWFFGKISASFGHLHKYLRMHT